MSIVRTIAFTELRRMFYSPLAWSLLAIVQFIMALIFLMLVQEYIEVIQPKFSTLAKPPGVTDTIVAAVYLWAGIIMLAIVPILTMRTFAEERVNGTFTLLRSSPISMTQVVLGKYLGLMLFILIMIALISLMPVSLYVGTSLDWGKLLASVLGLVLLLASFAAAGLFISSLVDQPIIAAVASFGFLLLLVVFYISGSSQSSHSELFIYLSHFGHFLSFLRGVFDTADLAYYLLFIVGFLGLTIRKLTNEGLQH